MKHTKLKIFILLTACYMLFTTNGFAQWSGTTPVTFGAPSSTNAKKVPGVTGQKGGCSGTGLCPSSFGINGVSTNFLYIPNPVQPGSPMSIAMSFNLAQGQQNGFIAPAPGQPYIIANQFTFSGNDGSGIPAGTVIAAGTQCLYTPDNGAPGISCVACMATAGGGSANVKLSAADKTKKEEDVTKKAKDLVKKKKK